jgi:two-component system KDP operon response regulator KdpE
VTQLPPVVTRILVVDDDPAVRRAYEEVLTAEGYQVATAGGRAEGLAALDRVNGQVDVFVVDIGLRDADGPEFARDAVERYGTRPTIYVSGWTEDFWDLSGAPGPWVVLRKPVPGPQLLEALRRLIEGERKPP